MKVLVEIDLTQDRKLMELCKSDPQIAAMLTVYNAMDEGPQSETYLEYIGKHLWQHHGGFSDTICDICEDDLTFYGQTKAFLFAFETTETAAVLFRMACHAPAAVSIKNGGR